MINAFKQIRLTNSQLLVTTGRLGIDSNTVMYLSDTGTLASNAYVNGISGSLKSDLAATGSYLYNLISSSSAGVVGINGISGQVTISGAGGNVVTLSGQTIYVSGNTGYLSSYYPISNPNQFIKSGDVNLDLSGLATSGNLNTLSGQFN